MRPELLEVLACPRCKTPLDLIDEDDHEVITTGALRCAHCDRTYPIVRGIPRFVTKDNYATSFGFQWNRFKKVQFDSANGTTLSRDRFFSETDWTPASLEGRWVLDGGCGAGRFLEIASSTGARVVGLDLSDAVDAAAAMLGDRPGLHLVQGGIDDLPFRPGAFDAVYCIGVIQHTSDPEACVRSLSRAVRPGGRLAMTVYEMRRFTRFYSKYWARRLTARMGDRSLLRLISVVMPVLFPITEVLYRLPWLGRLFRFVIPVANYVGERQLSLRQRYRWAVLDTFDMLAPAYDRPQTQPVLTTWLRSEGMEDVRRLPNPGLNVVATRPLTAPSR